MKQHDCSNLGTSVKIMSAAVILTKSHSYCSFAYYVKYVSAVVLQIMPALNFSYYIQEYCSFADYAKFTSTLVSPTMCCVLANDPVIYKSAATLLTVPNTRL